MSKYTLRPQMRGTQVERAELLIYGDIGDTWWDEQSVEGKAIVEQISRLGAVPLDIRVSSYGGVVKDGVEIQNAIRRHPGETTAHIDAVAYSVASLIALGADQVKMASNAMLMIHAPWAGAVGDEHDLREAADELSITREAMVRGYRRPGGRGPAEDVIRGWLTDRTDHYFGAPEAKELGLVDEVTGEAEIPEAMLGWKYQPRHQASARQIVAALRGNHHTAPAAAGKTESANMAEHTTASGGDTGTQDYLAGHRKAVAAATDKGARAEVQRQRMVRAALADFGEPDPTDPWRALEEDLLQDIHADEAEVNRRIIAMLRDRTDKPLYRPSPQSDAQGAYRTSRPQRESHVQLGADGMDKLVEGATKALMIRHNLERDPAVIQQEASSEFGSMSLCEIAKACARQAGIPTHGSRQQVLGRVLAAGPGAGTSHFPAILENIANKGVMDGYEQAQETWQDWTMRGNLQDYRQATRVNKSMFSKLLKMYEGDDFKHGEFKDVKQTIQGFLHGRAFSLTLQAMVDDDLGMLVDDTRAWGEAANVTIGDGVFTVLTATGTGGYGQTMTEDSTILFHADHSNYVASGSGAAPSSTTVAAARTAMSKQTDPNSRQTGIRPRFILHGTTLTDNVWPLLTSENVVTGATTPIPEKNWVKNAGLVSVEEYRFDTWVDTAWIMAAARRTVEVAFVGGQATPVVDRMPISAIPGVTWQISIPFGIAALDYRTFYLNYGA